MTVVRYPEELSLNKDTHYIQFKFLEPKSGGQFTGSNVQIGGELTEYSGENYESKFQEVKGLPTIIMYMPEDSGTQLTAAWGGRSFTLNGIAALKSGASAIQGINKITDLNSLGQQAQQIGSSTLNNVKSLLEAGGKRSAITGSILTGLLQAIPGVANEVNVNDVIQGATGQIFNPNVEMMYDGPQMRTLGLNFSMFAKSPTEASNIESIIRAFRMAGAPSFIAKDRFIKVPSYVKMQYMVGGKDNPYLPKHKLMNIMQVDVRYDNGQYAVFSDDRPIYTSVSIQLQESKLIFREDIEAGF